MASGNDGIDSSGTGAPPTQRTRSSRSQDQKQGGKSENGCCDILSWLIRSIGLIILFVCYFQPHYMIMTDMNTYLAKLDAANTTSNLHHRVEHISGSVYYGIFNLCVDVNIQWRDLYETEHKLPHVKSCTSPWGFKDADAGLFYMLYIMTIIGINLIGVAGIIIVTECVCCVKSVVVKNRLRLLIAVLILAGGTSSYLCILVLWCLAALDDAYYDWLNLRMNLDYPSVSSVKGPFDANTLFQKDWASILQLTFGILITMTWSHYFEIYRKVLETLRKMKNREVNDTPLESINDTPNKEI